MKAKQARNTNAVTPAAPPHDTSQTTASALNSAAGNARAAAHEWFERHWTELSSRADVAIRRLPVQRREDAAAEILAGAFNYAVHAADRGRLDRLTPYTLVSFFGRFYFSGRRLAGTATGDLLTEAGQRRHGTKVVSLESCRTVARFTARLADLLADAKVDPPFEQVRRMLDYPAILDREEASAKARRLFGFLCETAGRGRHIDFARALGVKPSRVTQLKRQLAAYLAAHGYEAPPTRASSNQHVQRDRQPSYLPRHRCEIPLNAGTSPGR